MGTIENETWSIKHASARLGIGTSTGYYLAARGDFPVPVVMIDGRKRVPKADLERYLAGETSIDRSVNPP